MNRLFPSWSVALLLTIGLVDLIVTAVLHRQGLIVELNPLMAFFITRSEWLFAFVKGLTLGAAWMALAWYAKTDKKFVSRASLAGSVAYVGIWCFWFFGAR